MEGSDLVVGVRDDGPGLTQELRKNAFELFTQGPETRARARGGLGIGLTLVRRLVELHGGSVEALSDGPGRGTEFVVRLPLRLPPVIDGVAAEVAVPAAGPRRRILVVDDNFDAAEALGELLRDYGHDVTTAHDGPQALDHARLERPQPPRDLDAVHPRKDHVREHEVDRLRRLPQLERLCAVRGPTPGISSRMLCV